MKRGSKTPAPAAKQEPLIPWNGEYHVPKTIKVIPHEGTAFVDIMWVDQDGNEHVWGSTSRIVFSMLQAYFEIYKPKEKKP